MKTISKFLFFAFLLFFNSAFADLASDAEKLFSWGEQKYPSYFSIGKTEVVTKILNYKGHDWYYRYYPETKVFLAINELNKVYVLGGVFGKNLLYVGRLEDLLDVPPSASSAQLKGNLSNANVKVYRVEDNGDKTIIYQEQTDSNGDFYAHEDELEDDKFYIYEVSGGVDNKGTIRAVTKGSWIKKQGLKVSFASEMAYIYLAKDLKYGFDATKLENRLNEVAKTILTSDISGDEKVTVTDLLSFNYQRDFNAINSSEFSGEKLEGIISDIYSGDFSYGDDIVTSIIGNYTIDTRNVVLFKDETKAFVSNTIIDINNPLNPTKIGNFNMENIDKIVLSNDETKAYIAKDTGDKNGLIILDITDNKNPKIIGHHGTVNGYARGIALSRDETKIFLGTDYKGFVIFDVSNYLNPVKIGSLDLDGNICNIVLSKDGTKAYLADYSTNGLVIVDISNPKTPIKISSIKTQTNGFGGAWDITLSNDETKAFIAKGDPLMEDGGLSIIDITDPKNPSKIGEFNINNSANGVTLSKDETKVFLSTERDGLLILDITNLSHPEKINKFDIGYIYETTLSNDETKAFIANLRHGLQIIDLELFTPISNKPKVEAPKTTTKNSVVAKITAPVGSQIVVNGTNTGVAIPESGKTNITLDTSGADGNKTFAIKFINVAGVESEEVGVTILKDATAPNKPTLTQTPPTYTQDNNITIEVNGEVGTTVEINGVNRGTIGSNGKKTILLDTSGDKDKTFTIKLIDSVGNSSESYNFTVAKSEKQTVIDHKTGLMWQDDEGAKNALEIYYDAVNYCNNLILAEYSDWRLPNIEELKTLMDLTKTSSPYIIDGFKNVAKWEYWSYNTKYSGYPDYQDIYKYAWVVNFHFRNSISKKEKIYYEHAYIRCVRKP